MSILVDKNTKVIVQGLTGKTGSFHTEQALADLELYLEHADQQGRDGLQQQINGLRGALNGSK